VVHVCLCVVHRNTGHGYHNGSSAQIGPYYKCELFHKGSTKAPKQCDGNLRQLGRFICEGVLASPGASGRQKAMSKVGPR
jgi:hypothetical protein